MHTPNKMMINFAVSKLLVFNDIVELASLMHRIKYTHPLEEILHRKTATTIVDRLRYKSHWRIKR